MLGYADVILMQMIIYLKDTYREVAHEDSVTLKLKLSIPCNTAIILDDYSNKNEDLYKMVMNKITPITDIELLAQAFVGIEIQVYMTIKLKDRMIVLYHTKHKQTLGYIF